MRSKPNNPCTRTTGSGGPRSSSPPFGSTPSIPPGPTSTTGLRRRATATPITAATRSATISATTMIVSTAHRSVTHLRGMRAALVLLLIAACYRSPGRPLVSDGDSDGDGISSADRCPDVPEDFDAFEDQDGCPEP